MIYREKNLRCLLLTCIIYLLQFSLYAQTDTIPKKSRDIIPEKSMDTVPKTAADTIPRKTFDNYLKTRKGLFGKMIKSLRRDTTEVQIANDLTRNDVLYKKFEGYIIRHVTISDLHFGIPLSDTSKKVVTTLTRLANKIHHITRMSVIKNNLFFNENDSLRSYLMADNETYLRQLPYLQDATIQVIPVNDTADSVDVNVIVKDLFALG